jgi:hypothetical protein
MLFSSKKALLLNFVCGETDHYFRELYQVLSKMADLENQFYGCNKNRHLLSKAPIFGSIYF